jgi:hypothetical protein
MQGKTAIANILKQEGVDAAFVSPTTPSLMLLPLRASAL